MEMSSIAVVTGTLTLSTLQTKTDAFANSVDPDETACNEPSHQDLHCLPFCFFGVLLAHPFATVDMSSSKLEEATSET